MFFLTSYGFCGECIKGFPVAVSSGNPISFNKSDRSGQRLLFRGSSLRWADRSITMSIVAFWFWISDEVFVFTVLDEPKSPKRISEIQSRCYSEILNAIQFGLFNNDLFLYHRDCYFEFENWFEFMRNGLLCEKWTFAVFTWRGELLTIFEIRIIIIELKTSKTNFRQAFSSSHYFE